MVGGGGGVRGGVGAVEKAGIGTEETDRLKGYRSIV